MKVKLEKWNISKEGNSSKKYQLVEQAKEWEKKVDTLWQSTNIKTIKELKRKSKEI